MKMVFAALLGASLVVATATPMAAQAHEKPHYGKQKKPQHHRHARPPRRDNVDRSDYYEHLADKLPVGSSRWFEQMEREGRFGRREN